LGKAIKELLDQGVDREDLVISTKFFQNGHHPNSKLLSRKHLVESMRTSLECLDLDYVDIIFCHRPDSQTPLEETCQAMHWLIEEGYAFYWATSEWPAEMIHRAIETCKKLNLHKPIADQCQHHMF
jgi:aryl-alcohol dehydrogenase-like predicted oxidoreductase